MSTMREDWLRGPEEGPQAYSKDDCRAGGEFDYMFVPPECWLYIRASSFMTGKPNTKRRYRRARGRARALIMQENSR